MERIQETALITPGMLASLSRRADRIVSQRKRDFEIAALAADALKARSLIEAKIKALRDKPNKLKEFRDQAMGSVGSQKPDNIYSSLSEQELGEILSGAEDPKIRQIRILHNCGVLNISTSLNSDLP